MIFVEIFHDFGWFFATRIRIRFIESDPDPTNQNETDPDPQCCFLGCFLCTIPILLLFYENNFSGESKIKITPNPH